jgi:hypothetical protein
MADEKNESIKFNLDEADDSLVQEVVDLNPESNPLEGPPPVNDGVHRFKLYFVDDTEKSSYTNKQGQAVPFFKLQFYGVCIDEDGPDNNKRIFGRENTLIFNGKNTLAYIIDKIYGDNAESHAYVKTLGDSSGLKLAKAFKQALAAEPIIKAKTEWNASFKDEEASAKAGKPKYRVAKSGQKNFPKNPDGSFRPVVNVEGVGEVKAQAKVLDYFADSK